jgi:hypothetical protein
MLYNSFYRNRPPSNLQLEHHVHTHHHIIGYIIWLFHIRIKGNRRPFKFNFPVYSYQEILLTNFRCTFVVVSLSLLQSLNPNIDIIFLLFVLQYNHRNRSPSNLQLEHHVHTHHHIIGYIIWKRKIEKENK